MMKQNQSSRIWVQHLFLIITIYIGSRFYWFVHSLENGVLPGFKRPAGVEAFLPLSALISLKHLLLTHTISGIHPAGLVVFLLVCLSALLARRGFCSWVCPVGLVSDYLSRLHALVFKYPLPMPRWLDIPLKSIKYLIAGFFIYQVFFNMSAVGIEQFLNSPYNRFADIKMLRFFTDISAAALGVVSVLVLLTFFFRGFWCRYLCPYGALLGVIGLLSPARVRRNPARCTGCGKCERHCPGQIKISQKIAVSSPECSACLTCVTVCSETDVLSFSWFQKRVQLTPIAVGALFVLLFGAGIGGAMVTGHWQGDISAHQYLAFTHRDKILTKRTKATFKPGRVDEQKMIMMIKARTGKSIPSSSQYPHNISTETAPGAGHE